MMSNFELLINQTYLNNVYFFVRAHVYVSVQSSPDKYILNKRVFSNYTDCMYNTSYFEPVKKTIIE